MTWPSPGRSCPLVQVFDVDLRQFLCASVCFVSHPPPRLLPHVDLAAGERTGLLESGGVDRVGNWLRRQPECFGDDGEGLVQAFEEIVSATAGVGGDPASAGDAPGRGGQLGEDAGAQVALGER